LNFCFNKYSQEEVNVALNFYNDSKTRSRISKTPNVIDLINKSKLEQKREKRQNIIIAAAAVSALAISGFLITF